MEGGRFAEQAGKQYSRDEMNTRRTFIAIKIKASGNLADFFSMLHDELKHSSIKWVDVHNLHLTLAFLGDTTEMQVTQVSSALGRVAELQQSFDFSVQGFGYFGGRQAPRVLWLGVRGGDPLKAIHAKLWEELSALGFIAEERDFSPHLTLGRVREFRDQQRLSQLLGQFKETAFQDVAVEEIIFYESLLNPEGPIYKPIKRFSLRQEEHT